MTAIRHNTLKTPQSDQEDERFRKVCAAQGKQRAPTVRELISKYCDEFEARLVCLHTHVSASRINREGPRHGHFASGKRRVRVSRAPVRATFGGAPLNLRV